MIHCVPQQVLGPGRQLWGTETVANPKASGVTFSQLYKDRRQDSALRLSGGCGKERLGSSGASF